MKSVNRTQRNIVDSTASAVSNKSMTSDQNIAAESRIVSVHLSEIGKYVSYGGLYMFHSFDSTSAKIILD